VRPDSGVAYPHSHDGCAKVTFHVIDNTSRILCSGSTCSR
jgi:hypothetical protein